jgi:Protein of unknown function (DUF3592)
MFGKKRGHRRTGSKLWGSAGEALFFATLLGIGAGFLLLLLVKMVVPEWRANHDFVRTDATVLKTRLGESVDNDGRAVFRPEVLIRYSVDDEPREVWTYDITCAYSPGKVGNQRALDRFEPDERVPCWYDPLNPSVAVVVRGYTWWFWMLLCVPIGFILIGGGGLVYSLWQWGKSAEHQAARGQLSRIDLVADLEAAVKEYPTVPHHADLTNSPGTKLAFRLPVQTSQGWRLFGATAICLIWNAIVIGFIVAAIRDHLRGNWQWGFDLLIVPFALGGTYLIYYFVRELLIATGIGPTLVEISAHPLVPRMTYRLHLTQGGNLTVNHLEVALHCEERSAYRQGTDLRHDCRVVHHQSLLRREGFEIRPGEPFQADCEFEIPPGAMHSFQADHNEVQWTLVVEADAEGWPPFRRSFSIVVYPPERNPTPPDAAAEPTTQQITV